MRGYIQPSSWLFRRENYVPYVVMLVVAFLRQQKQNLNYSLKIKSGHW